MNPIKLASADELQHSAMLQSPRTCTPPPTLHTAVKTGLSVGDEKELFFVVFSLYHSCRLIFFVHQKTHEYSLSIKVSQAGRQTDRHTDKCTDKETYTHGQRETHTYSRAHTHTHTRTYTNVRTYARTHAHTHTHTHARAHARTHANTSYL
jgi:hypothetical protein